MCDDSCLSYGLTFKECIQWPTFNEKFMDPHLKSVFMGPCVMAINDITRRLPRTLRQVANLINKVILCVHGHVIMFVQECANLFNGKQFMDI